MCRSVSTPFTRKEQALSLHNQYFSQRAFLRAKMYRVYFGDNEGNLCRKSFLRRGRRTKHIEHKFAKTKIEKNWMQKAFSPMPRCIYILRAFEQKTRTNKICTEAVFSERRCIVYTSSEEKRLTKTPVKVTGVICVLCLF